MTTNVHNNINRDNLKPLTKPKNTKKTQKKKKVAVKPKKINKHETLPAIIDEQVLNALIAKDDDCESLKEALRRFLPQISPHTREAIATFLNLMANGDTFVKAAEKSGVCWPQVQGFTSQHPEFKQLYDISRQCMRAVQIHQKEDALHKRGVTGWNEPIMHNGKQVSTITRYSDKCLEIGLKAEKREKYGDKVSHEVSGGVQLNYTLNMPDKLPQKKQYENVIEGECVEG